MWLIRYSRLFNLLWLTMVWMSMYSQDGDYFRSPINHETRLSGSFAEPRSQHFHAGIDYKQLKGVPYDSIYAGADGYISRINVKPDGYGNALYIAHPNGYTTVYAHLHHFNDEITDYITEHMIQKRVHKVEHYLMKDRIQVKKGDYIGILGNTGRSFGAHLHFEIRKTESETPINPALFKLKSKDFIAPTIKGVMIYSLTPDGEILDHAYYPAKALQNHQYRLQEPMIKTNALIVGLGVHAYDTMNGASNHNGAYGVTLKNNGQAIFNFEMDSIPFDHSRYIHAHMDYDAKTNNRYISKCYRLQSNPLNIYDTTLTTGQLITSDLIANNLEIEVYDIEGNRATLEFDLLREGLVLAPRLIDSSYIRLTPTDRVQGQHKGYIWKAPQGLVEKPEYLKFNVAMDTFSISSFTQVPLFKSIQLQFTPNKNFTESTVIVTKNSKGTLVSLACEAKDSKTIVTLINKLGQYWIDLDTIAPRIQLITLPKGLNKRLKFKISDNYEALYARDQMKYEVFIDNQWVLCQHDSKNNTVWHDVNIPSTNQAHDVKIKVSDSCGNHSHLSEVFHY